VAVAAAAATTPVPESPVVAAPAATTPVPESPFVAAESTPSALPAVTFPPVPVVDPTSAPLADSRTVQQVPEIPRISLELPPASELVLVETSHDRAPAGSDEELDIAPRGRARPPRVEVSDERLEMVETTRKESSAPAE